MKYLQENFSSNFNFLNPIKSAVIIYIKELNCLFIKLNKKIKQNWNQLVLKNSNI